MATTGQTGSWFTIRGSASDVRSTLDTEGIDREDVLGVAHSGSEFFILSWKGID